MTPAGGSDSGRARPILGHIRVGDASFGSLRDIGDGRCHLGSDLKATESRPIVPETLLTLSR